MDGSSSSCPLSPRQVELAGVGRRAGGRGLVGMGGAQEVERGEELCFDFSWKGLGR